MSLLTPRRSLADHAKTSLFLFRKSSSSFSSSSGSVALIVTTFIREVLVKGYSFDFAPLLEGYFFFVEIFGDCCLFNFEDMYISLPWGYPSLNVSGELLIATHGDDAP